MKVRKARKNDAEKIKQIIDLLYFDPNHEVENPPNGFLRFKRNLRQIKAMIKKAVFFLVAEDKGEVIGFMGFHNRQDHIGKASIKWQDTRLKQIYSNKDISVTGQIAGIKPEHQSRGVGQKLLKKIEKILIKQGYKHSFATIIDKPVPNIASQQFIQKMGYELVAQGPMKKGSKEIVNVYYKNLN